MEYKIERMTTTDSGFQIARVLSYYDQITYTVHNRYGSWFIGDPYEKAVMRAPETISSELPFDLQAFKNGRGGAKIQDAPTNNIFMKKSAPVNSFIKKVKSKENPFVAKAAKKANLFMDKSRKA